MSLPSYGVVVLSQGRRPELLDTGLRSVLRQVGVTVDVVVVGNGWEPVGLPAGVRAVALPANVGIPAGRNAGVPHVHGDLLLFLDDDAALRDDDGLARLAERFASDPGLGLVQPRVMDPEGRPAPRRWVPRLRVGDPGRSSAACAVWEGCVVLRPEALAGAGGWAGELFYGHEGIDLAWGVWDAGWTVRYDAQLVALHEANDPRRQPELHRLSSRNRVWLARRRLPAPLLVLYPLLWLVLSVARDRAGAGRILLGYREGLGGDPGPRRPMSWRTVWRMTRAGRPPLL